MWRATIKGLLAHKLRLGLTALAIVLGVTFVSGTLVLTDTLRQTFTSLFGNIYQKVDFVVRADASFKTSSPWLWPSVSLICLKPSRSTNMSANRPFDISARWIA